MPELLLQAATPASVLSRTNPFPGLRPYEEEDANWFFGRAGEINELLKRLRRLHFVAIVGASGSGKSSLVRAGVLPQIRDGYLDAEWLIAAFRPGERPIGNLAEALCPTGDLARFTEILRSGAMGLVKALQREGLPPGGKVLILVDQFEELFQFARRTGDAAQEEIKEFLKLLLAAASSDDVPIYVVVTMRLEWLNECATYVGLAEAINEGIYLVPQMRRRQFQQTILGPLEAAGGAVTTALLDRMLNDLDNRSDQLPILQHALMRIWERCGAGRPFDTGEYEAVGTFSNCLSAHAEEVFAELNNRQKKVCELLFRNITQVYQNRKIRRPQPVSEILKSTGGQPAELEAVILAFSKAGRSFVVTTQGALTPASIVDVSHEALIRQWVRLCAWVESEADIHSRVTRLEEDAAEWDRNKEAFKGSLYQGYRLQRAEELRPSLEQSTKAIAFLNESSRAHLRRRILKRGSISLAVILVVAVALGMEYLSVQRAKALARLADAQRQQAEAEANTASLQAKKAQQFQNDLVQKIGAANGSASALAAIAKDIQADRVYLQYSSADSQLARTVQAQLLKRGYVVPGSEQVGPDRVPPQTQVRFFHTEDKADAAKIAGLLKSLVAGNVAVQASANPKDVVPAGQFEVWLVPANTASAQQAHPSAEPAVNSAGQTAAAQAAIAESKPESRPVPAAVPAPSLEVLVSQDSIQQGGKVTLTWRTENASEVQIEGLGRQEPNGSVVVAPSQSTFYRLNAIGPGGNSPAKLISVKVVAPTLATAAAAVGTNSEPAAVKAALNRYKDAYESESLDELKRAWPSLSKAQQKNTKFVFDQFNAIHLSLTCRDDDIRIEGDSASAVCRQSAIYTQKGKKQPEQTTSTAFKLKKQEGAWVVDAVQ